MNLEVVSRFRSIQLLESSQLPLGDSYKLIIDQVKYKHRNTQSKRLVNQIFLRLSNSLKIIFQYL